MSNLRERHFENVEQTFAGCFDTMLDKAHDYAEDDNPYSNFEFAADVAKITVEQGLLFLKGIKLARLRELLLSGKDPKNEPTDDTCDDDINYTAILKSYRAVKEGPAEPTGYEDEPDYLSELPVGIPTPRELSAIEWFKNILHPEKPTNYEKV